MPKQTFFNLVEEKRRVIEQAALDEFAEYGFDNSNMNRIVAASKIAKGSFYQYFTDKKDLYYHLIDSLIQRKMIAMAPVLERCQDHGFTHNLEELFRLGLEFADTDAKFYSLGNDFATMKPSFIQEYMEKYSPMAQDIYGHLLEAASAKGELCDDLDLSLAKVFIDAIINRTTISLINQPKARRNYVIRSLLVFIERAVLKDRSDNI